MEHTKSIRRLVALLLPIVIGVAVKSFQRTEYFKVRLNDGKEIANWVNDGFWSMVDHYELYQSHYPAFQSKEEYLKVCLELKLLGDNYDIIRQEAESFLMSNKEKLTILETHFTEDGQKGVSSS